MSIGLNKVQLIGNLGAAPKLIKSEENGDFAVLSVAVNDSKKNEKKAEWHEVVAFGEKVNFIKHLKKGDLIYLEGGLKGNKYIGKDGAERKSWNILAKNILRLGKASQ